MICCGDREKYGDLKSQQKWDYINLNDFKASSCWTPLAYGYLWVMLFVSISVYAVDTFTAINLLAFDRWAGQIEPEIPLRISRWIFAGCIILSFLLLIYRWVRAIRVMKQGGVARSYLDPLAVRIQSIRPGQGRGWRRFLVFAELTKSRKGADYVALFAYYSFEAWLRIVFAEGPRQVVNGITLYSVMRLKLIPEGAHAPSDGHTPIVQFFVNIGILADQDKFRAVIYFGMLWTLLIWVISALSLAISVILYLLFLWHHIPSADGTLTVYCRRKIDRRMGRIVQTKVDKALKKENEIRAREEARQERDGGIKKQPTLPVLGGQTDPMSGLSRQTTMTTLPEYSSRPSTNRESDENYPSNPTLLDLDGPRPGPQRSMTYTSEASFSSHAPLMSAAGDMGYAPSDRSYTPTSATQSPWGGRPPPLSRNMTGMSQNTQRSHTPGISRPGTAQSGWTPTEDYALEPMPRPPTSNSTGSRHHNDFEPGMNRTYSEDRERGTNYNSQYTMPSRGGPRDNPYGPPTQRTLSNTSNPYFPVVNEFGARQGTPGPHPPLRSQAPSRGPGDRSFTPLGQASFPRTMSPMDQTSFRSTSPENQPPIRMMTPSQSTNSNMYSTEPPIRMMTPSHQPPFRTASPIGAPSLPRLETSRSNGSQYTAFSPEPRSTTPASAGDHQTPYRGFSRNEDRYGLPSNPAPSASSARFPPRNSPPRRNGYETDDILSHY